MRVLLIDQDSLIPNLALMKLSTYHRNEGDVVGFESMKNPDLVYVSMMFKKSGSAVHGLRWEYPNAKIIIGGPGHDPSVRLPGGVDESRPDYSLYPEYQDSIGRVTIGCIRKCHFCFVPQMGHIRYIQPIWDFFQGGIVRILDDNILALPSAWEETAGWLIENQVTANFDALDVRLVDEKVAGQISEIKHKMSIHFAFDFTSYEQELRRGIRLLEEAGVKPYRLMFYVYMHSEKAIPDAKYRWSVLRELGVEPFLMINLSIKKTKRLKQIHRRGCRPAIWRNLTPDEVFE